MPKITYLDNAKPSGLKLYLVYYLNQKYEAVEVSGLSRSDAIAQLPTTIIDGVPNPPNFIQQMARSEHDAIALVQEQRAEELLQSLV